MNRLGRTAILTMVSLLFVASQAHALNITFGGVDATQYIGTTLVDAGLTADKSGINAATNTADTLNGWFIETFDKDGAGGLTTLDPTKLTVVGGYDFSNTSTTGVAAAPANDDTYYAFTPEQGGGTPASVTIPITAFYAYDDFGPGNYIDYMGLYFGSIDTYNSLIFHVLEGDDIILTGTQILEEYYNGISYSGDWTASASNVYVNLDFDLLGGEIFTGFTLATTGVALELDNIVTHVTAVPAPEPSTFILLGAGLLGLVAFGRRKYAK